MFIYMKWSTCMAAVYSLCTLVGSLLWQMLKRSSFTCSVHRYGDLWHKLHRGYKTKHVPLWCKTGLQITWRNQYKCSRTIFSILRVLSICYVPLLCINREADILYKHLEFHTTTVYKVVLINGSVMVQWKKACPYPLK